MSDVAKDKIIEFPTPLRHRLKQARPAFYEALAVMDEAAGKTAAVREHEAAVREKLADTAERLLKAIANHRGEDLSRMQDEILSGRQAIKGEQKPHPLVGMFSKHDLDILTNNAGFMEQAIALDPASMQYGSERIRGDETLIRACATAIPQSILPTVSKIQYLDTLLAGTTLGENAKSRICADVGLPYTKVTGIQLARERMADAPDHGERKL